MWKRSTSFLKKLRPCQTYVTQTFLVWRQYITAQKMKFTITDFFSKCDQIRSVPAVFCAVYLRKSTPS